MSTHHFGIDIENLHTTVQVLALLLQIGTQWMMMPWSASCRSFSPYTVITRSSDLMGKAFLAVNPFSTDEKLETWKEVRWTFFTEDDICSTTGTSSAKKKGKEEYKAIRMLSKSDLTLPGACFSKQYDIHRCTVCTICRSIIWKTELWQLSLPSPVYFNRKDSRQASSPYRKGQQASCNGARRMTCKCGNTTMCIDSVFVHFWSGYLACGELLPSSHKYSIKLPPKDRFAGSAGHCERIFLPFAIALRYIYTYIYINI